MSFQSTSGIKDEITDIIPANLAKPGIVQLTNTIDASEDKAVTPKAVQDALAGAGGGGAQGSTTLSGLTDVKVSGQTDGQVLAYSNSDKKWINKTISAGSGNDPQAVKLTGDQTIDGNKKFVKAVAYTTDVQITDNKHLATKKYVDEKVAGAGGSSVNAVTTDGAQTITGLKTFTINNEALKFKSNNNQAQFLSFHKQDQRKVVIGSPSASDSNTFKIAGENNAKLVIDGFSDVGIPVSLTLGTTIKAGTGGGIVKFSPEDNSNKTLVFSNGTVGNNAYFNLDLDNKGKIIKLKDGTDAKDAVNKGQVDALVGTLSQLQTSAKDSLVAAINELKQAIDGLRPGP